MAGGADPEMLVFDSDQALARLAQHGDAFAPVLELEQRLPDLRGSGS